MTLLDLVQKGGFLIYPIMICSIIALAIFIERFIIIKQQLLSHKELEDIKEAIRLMDESKLSGKRKIIYKIAQEGINTLTRNSSESSIKEYMEHEVQKGIKEISKHLGMLATIGNITPLLGLLGTVIGMIKAFMVIEKLGGKVNASVLAGGIWEAMLTTAAGLSVAIPAMIALSYINSKVDDFQSQCEEIAISIIKLAEDNEGKKI